ncbi:MAG TPA: MBL fold metallo-hydrolase [Gemmatimonadales bacterium]|nr:MBL fold metallo-hydrolase [Gemmatimonadales bacterium]
MPETGRPRLQIWGCRGSIPVGGPGTARYGGATACVVVEEAGRRLVLDAGSGIRSYGRSLNEAERGGSHTLLLSHTHWDHLCGLPFFAPLYDPGATVTILGPHQPSATLPEIIERLFAPAVWPLPPRARIKVYGVEPGAFQAGGFQISAVQVAHAGMTLGYRVATESGQSVSYVTDNELAGMHPSVRAELVQLLAGSDVLLHDATWADAILDERAGWGHSSVGETIALGMEAGCRLVVLFHHDPDADDEELERNLATALGGSTGTPEVILARDGMTLEL